MDNKKKMYLRLSVAFFVLFIIFLTLTLTNVPENRLSINGIKKQKPKTLYIIISIIIISLTGFFIYKFINESKKDKN
uniref:Uncharacterized protein n=1 Tax=Mimiviridae sp. ChoanoV1 TaxID=2596887 RepID=A0A5B8IQU0_9VIRU|nr:hypothetical protein 7_1 [Mimiviridae sp. ChoanoV1]